jgi:hypothetical protein
MVRSITALMFALILSPSVSFAQAVVLTVNGTGTSVYKAPSNASPVVGQAQRGTALEVTREVGDWVKVTWPAAPDKVGYVRRTAGVVGAPGAAAASTPAAATRPAAASARTATASTTRTAAPAPSPAVSAPAPSPAPAASPVMASANDSAAQIEPTSIRPRPSSAGYVASPSHKLGLGILAGGPSMGLGFSVRKWTAGPIGLQLDALRTSTSTVPFVTSMTSMQVGPRVLYSLRDRVSDYTWVRPYLGAGGRYYRSSLADPGLGTTASDSRMGAQVFGGAEVSLSSAPRFGLSVDVGYDWFTSPYPGYELDGVAVTVGGRWYMR